MLCLRVTAKLAQRLKKPLDPAPAASTGVLGDWYVNHLIVQRQHLLLAVSERTLLPIVMPAKDVAMFPLRLQFELEEMLKRIGISKDLIRAEESEMMRWCLAKTANRQVLGSMNDFAYMLEAYLGERMPLEEISLRLADSPCSPLGRNDPIRATQQAFASPSDLRPQLQILPGGRA